MMPHLAKVAPLLLLVPLVKAPDAGEQQGTLLTLLATRHHKHEKIGELEEMYDDFKHVAEEQNENVDHDDILSYNKEEGEDDVYDDIYDDDDEYGDEYEYADYEDFEEDDEDDDDDYEEEGDDLGMCPMQDTVETGVEQVFNPPSDPFHVAECQRRYQQSQEHVKQVANDPDLSPLMPRCKNHYELCTLWAVQGYCEEEADMLIDCAPACLACDMLLYENRCPLNPNEPSVWAQPGDLNKFFERIITDPDLKQKYEPRIWSRPSLAPGDEDSTQGSRDYFLGPWVVSLENVVTEKEAERLIELGEENGFKRSDDWGEYLPDGTYRTYFHKGRTSYQTWCPHCHDDDLAESVWDRITAITGVPDTHSEALQLLRYQKGQKYDLHHDYDYQDRERQPGVRIFTFFIYLSDVERGGETHFPYVGNLTFTPKRGRVVIWPNVLDEDPNEMDERTEHAALPVVQGTKFASNAWFHQHDWWGPAERLCVQ